MKVTPEVQFIKKLREETGCGMIDARKLYEAFQGDMELAKEAFSTPAFNIDHAIKYVQKIKRKYAKEITILEK
jgi:translation elongation factor EF-Ts